MAINVISIKDAHHPDVASGKMKLFCMSHLGWVFTNTGLCPECGSAMLEKEDLT